MTRKTRLLAATGAAAVAVAVTVGAKVGLQHEDKKTPCEAAVEIVNTIRDKEPSTVSYAEQRGVGYGPMLRALITGGFEDIDGEASPAVAEHLRRVADDLAAAQAAPTDEFTTGKTGRDMDDLVAACEAED